MRMAFGDLLPAYDKIGEFLPLRLRMTNGKKQSWVQTFPLDCALGLAAVYWNAVGGPTHFRQSEPQGKLRANWVEISAGEGGELSTSATVYEDPHFTNTSKVTVEGRYERLIDPDEAKKVHEPGQEKNSKYTGASHMETSFNASSEHQWWPVWLVCRTKTGWWTICWYQLIDGSELVEFWWYAEDHVHPIHTVL